MSPASAISELRPPQTTLPFTVGGLNTVIPLELESCMVCSSHTQCSEVVFVLLQSLHSKADIITFCVLLSPGNHQERRYSSQPNTEAKPSHQHMKMRHSDA